ncbi:MAG TPA: xanthine dehydrogenase family protein molybdopterin-binding subunit, partial [Vicinamibacteria bacterium]
EGALHGVTLRSKVARGTIREIRFDPSYDWSSVVVATAADIPGENAVVLIEKDQPLLASRELRHREEPILVLGHSDRAKAYEALEHIEVTCDEEEPVLTMESALANDAVFKRFEILKGDVDAGFRGADVIVEEEYRLPHQEQAYIEPNGIAAWEEANGTLVVMGSMQCPYYVHKALLGLFPRAPEKIRVIQTVTGGGFGGKEEYPNLVAGHAALLALKARRPVKIVYDRAEDMRATTKRHPARIRHRTGVKKDGTIVAQDIDVLMDGGAYVTLSPVVLSRGVLHATGPYECPNVRVIGRVVATNTPPNGAFRGFGAPQTLFAAEMQVEKIAARLGLDPLVVRKKNLFREGSVTATGQVLKESVGAEAVLDRAIASSDYRARRKACERWNGKKTAPSWRGVGLAAVFHGAGFTGSGEVYLKSRASVSLLPGGEIEIEAASTEIGQGTTSILASIVADALGVPYDWIRVSTPDTAKVPNSGPTVASRTCMIVGGILKRSADDLKRALEREGVLWPPTPAALKRAARKLCRDGRPFGFVEEYERPREIRWDDATYRGDAYGVYSYAAMVVELEVDKLTFEVAVRDVVTAQDVGRAINPLLVEGQIVGGTAQGLGYALLENVIFDGGAMANANFTNYVIPTTLDTPEIRVEIVEVPYSLGPFGAKGVGELPMDLPAPAIAAAIHHATGIFPTEIPL